MRDLVPLIETSGAHLVLSGHSHVWNRFKGRNGVHYLETSNVGNTYGAYWKKRGRPNLPIDPENPDDYVASGNPYGLDPIVPTLAPLQGEEGETLPYVSSDDLAVFTLLETESRKVSSYYFDPCRPEAGVVKFDEFSL